MISYAQNYEDVILQRAFEHLDSGFYIDVGAYHPSEWSVTRHFYERGWRGINIEPQPDLHQQFEQARPRDTNLQLAVNADAESLELYIVDDPQAAHTALSTADPQEYEARRHEGLHTRSITVPCRSLSSIFAEYVTAPVDFLKIDVEGFELAVVRSNDWRVNRPRVLVIEATKPLTRISNHENWEPLLLDADYHYAYFDGLNRFYVRGEDRSLIERIAIPPNVLDDFVQYREYAIAKRLRKLERKSLWKLLGWRARRALRGSGSQA